MALDASWVPEFADAVNALAAALGALGRRRLAAATGVSSLHRTFLRVGAQRDPMTLLDLTAQAVGDVLGADAVRVAEHRRGRLEPATTWVRTASSGTEPTMDELLEVAALFGTGAGVTTGDHGPGPALVGLPLRAASEDVGYVVARAAAEDEIAWRRLVDAELVCAHAASVLYALRTQERLSAEAAQDSLTGLWNHRRFHTDVGRLRGRPHVLVLCDLDDFKLINDMHGHAAGDDALRAVARVLLQVSRDGDLAYRLGGEEFALVLPRATVEAGVAVAERVQRELRRAAPMPGLTLSCGVAVHPEDADDPRTLLEAADRALYTSKRQGKDTVTRAGADRPRPSPATPLELPSGEETELVERARADVRSAAAVLELAARLQDCAGIEDLGDAVSAALLEHVSADRISFWASGGDGLARLVAASGPTAESLLAAPPAPYRPTADAPDVAALRRGEVWTTTGTENAEWPADLAPIPASGGVMQVPILDEGRLRATISVTRLDGEPFTARDASMARAFATQAALALRSWSARDEAERTIVATVEALVEALAAKDEYTSEHGLEVQHLTVETGVALGLSGDSLGHLSQAAVLHDIGKIGVPLEVLRKPGPLDPTELALIRQHPILGARILQPVSRLRPVIPLVRSSHERWDGGGYPDGLAAEDIPLGARIIAVVDAYSAMTTDRPYRASLPDAHARQELVEHAGSQFDADVVRAFTRGARPRLGSAGGGRRGRHHVGAGLAVRQRRDAPPHGAHALAVEVGDADALVVAGGGQHQPPRVDDQRAAEGRAAVPRAVLVRRHHEGAVLDRARPQQHLPVVAAPSRG